jgi:carboxynorspermidine decarboxylase
MLDHLIYRTNPKLSSPVSGSRKFMIAGRSCLAGDVFGTYKLKNRLKVGNEVRFADAAGYTMVKKNWFNGVNMPSIVVRRLTGKVEKIREFGYEDFRDNLS